jgi:glycosyltransferase involved in cell wall biosynthesis
VTFYELGDLVETFKFAGIQVRSARKNGRWDIVPFILRLIKIIKEEKPDVTMSYLVAANLLAILLKPVLQPSKIVISIRYSFIRDDDYDWLSKILYDLEKWIAGWSNLIIVNSSTGALLAQSRGINPEKMVVIPNGIDTQKFHPDSVMRNVQRKELGFTESYILIGIIGRLDPVKNHMGFLDAAAIVANEISEARFLVIGDGPEYYKNELLTKIKILGLTQKCSLLTTQLDPVPIYNALDICVSSSIGEGFSNVVAEAMSCEVPCVVTDVGDSAAIVGETGFVVPSDNPQKLAEAILQMSMMKLPVRQELGRLARERIKNNFSVEKMVTTTMHEFEKLG